jgi:XTP/dITP diphosphohydrolase
MAPDTKITTVPFLCACARFARTTKMGNPKSDSPVRRVPLDVKAIVRDKALRAFAKIGHRIFVEQTCLYIDALNGFPGGLTQPFWDSLEADRFCELFGHGENCGLTASTWIGYCDGQRIHHFEGRIRGTVAAAPRGDRTFQWDCVFVPHGHERTFAEMGEEKNEISMRRIALNAFAKHLRGNDNA